MIYSRQAWRGPLWLRFDGTAGSALFTRLGRSGMAGNPWHGVAIRRMAGNAAKRRDTYARQAWLPKARPDQFWTSTAGIAALGGDRSPMARQARQTPHSNDGKHRITAGTAWKASPRTTTTRQARLGSASTYRAGRFTAGMGRKAWPFIQGLAWFFKSRPARRCKSRLCRPGQDGLERASSPGRHGAAWSAYHGRHLCCFQMA